MKAIYNIGIGVMALLCMGCEDFLDKKPLGTETIESLYKTEEGAQKALNVCYAHMRAEAMVKAPFQAITEISSDDSDTGSEISDGLVPQLNLIDNFTYSTTDNHVYSWYSTNYAGINRCNQVIYNIDRTPISDTEKDYISAQAKFLRAYYFFNLVRSFGDIPKVDKWIVSETDISQMTKSSEEDIYSFIISDLTAIENTIPTRADLNASNEIERISREAVQALLAKVYLFHQDYTNAQIYAKKVIESPSLSLYPDFQKLFWPEGTNCSEAILCGQYKYASNRNTEAFENFYIRFMGVRENRRGWGFIAPTLTLYNAYDINDPRRDLTIFASPKQFVEDGDEIIDWSKCTHPRANGKTLIPKRLYPEGKVFLAEVNPHFIRLADIMLVYAEACNELNNPDEALIYLEKIRYRARGNKDFDPENAPLPKITERDKAKLRHIIWNERRFELALENHRFFDLMRYEKVESGYATATMQKDGKTNFNYSRHGKYPIPETEVLISDGKIEQNDAWK
ncbi:RagB/SusD family nutrient uptake outer membrane protein [Bacteroides cellulosilyticus]|uniref:RagB/SusD family nutrient uptake outer membrane protein n=1 Tax=Bacteroides cellulosilyticus TaxID=246787 RepID=UPI0032C08BA1